MYIACLDRLGNNPAKTNNDSRNNNMLLWEEMMIIVIEIDRER